jgi:hypothetical protein
VTFDSLIWASDLIFFEIAYAMPRANLGTMTTSGLA